ncbi:MULTISPECIES: hypothetical protein [unclassified Methylobacterium]|uniref:hypothetical protein n=1 Tax=unclassified Methylobacterium TaxID=2615210 RepID=UPI001FBB23C8|nr:MULTISPECIES: hypothetical protein [unclassified Methylobacterium]MCJ2018103.1 hypothetical protein [Methylobacterium sp. E-065]
MRALLTSGIKAILAVAALSTAAHWTLRVQRESTAAPVPVASLADPVATGSIEPRPIERQAERSVAAASMPAGATQPAPRPAVASGLDQSHLAALIAGAAPAKPKVAKATTRTASAEKAPAVEKVAAKR